jgi:hypothetical protein
MTMARVGAGALTTPLTRGVCRGHHAHARQQLAGMINARAGAACRDPRARHGARDAASGLQCRDHRGHVPGVARLVEGVVQTRPACGGLGDRPHLCVDDAGLRGGGTHPRGEPPAVGGAPRGPAGSATSVPEPDGWQAACGRVASSAGIVTGAGAVAAGCIVHGGDIDGGASPRAPQARQWPGIPTGGCDAVAGLFRQECGGHPPTGVPPCAPLAVKPRAPWAGGIDTAERWRLGVECADAVIAVGVSRPDGATGGDFSTVVVSDRRDRECVLMDITTDVECARVGQG